MHKVRTFATRLWRWVEHVHSAWWVITTLGASVVAALVALLQKLRAHVDVLSIALVFVVSLVLFFLVSRSRKEPKSNGTNASTARMVPWSGTVSALLTSSSATSARLFGATTAGTGEQEFALGVCPRKLAFDPPGIIVSEKDLHKTITIGGKQLTVLRFTNSGFVLDDRGSQVDIRAYVLEGSTPIESATPFPTVADSEAPTPDSHLSRMAPRLKYEGLRCWGDWAFPADLGVCALQVVAIRNTQVSIMNTANNVTASIEYKHDDGIERFVVKTATWIRLQRRDKSPVTGGSRLSRSVSLAGNEAQDLIVTMQDRDGRVFSSLEANDSYNDISVGHWTITATIPSDNADTLVLRGGFTLLQDGNRLVFDQPAFS